MQAPQATPFLAHDASAVDVASALSSLQPIESSSALVEVERTGPFVGGGYSWSIALKPEEPVNGDELVARLSTIPKIGVQEAHVTGTGARFRVERREAREEAAAEHLVSLAAPSPPETAEVQVIECSVTGMTSDASLAGVSFTLQFRGEVSEVSTNPPTLAYVYACALSVLSIAHTCFSFLLGGYTSYQIHGRAFTGRVRVL